MPLPPKTVFVKADEVKFVLFTYEEEVAPPPPLGTLTVLTEPIPGPVYVNAVYWGEAPQTRDVSPGEYTVTFGGVAGYKLPEAQTVVVKPGAITTVIGVYEPIKPPPRPFPWKTALTTTTVAALLPVGAKILKR